ncbi:MAG: hypothetical protein PUK59_00020 [Actinomycetaceae bacterium]|nr:hypothetical protein [Actinomycetaceae bacterium]
MVKRYSQEFKDRVVRMVTDRLDDDRSCMQWRAINDIASRLETGNGRAWTYASSSLL